MVVRNNVDVSWLFSQAMTAASGKAFMASATMFVSTMIMLTATSLFEVDGLVRLPRGKLQVRAPGRPEDLQEQIAQSFRRRDGSRQDLASLFFHRYTLPGRTVPKSTVDLVVKFADAQTGQGTP